MPTLQLMNGVPLCGTVRPDAATVRASMIGVAAVVAPSFLQSLVLVLVLLLLLLLLQSCGPLLQLPLLSARPTPLTT